MAKEFKYNVDENFDHTFDEKGNIFLALRKVSWGDNIETKLDLRKWYVNANGEETVGKGFSFLTEEGPNELTKVLLDNGFGYTEEVIESIKDRNDFIISLTKVLNKPEDEILNIGYREETYYDPTLELLSD